MDHRSGSQVQERVPRPRPFSTRADEHALRMGLAPYSDESDVARVLADQA
jgi:hypothetical protein